MLNISGEDLLGLKGALRLFLGMEKDFVRKNIYSKECHYIIGNGEDT